MMAIKQFTIQHANTHPYRSSDVDKNRSCSPVFPWPWQTWAPEQRRGVCSQGKTKQWLCLGTAASEREARHGEGSHTQKKTENEGQRERERMGVGEWGGRERKRERTLPGVSFFLSAIINGILPLTHSSL